uniref:Uncharacterized protein n=1 Tax=Arundo donax TaxID=35708 RepID=A0A0A8XXM3_ARUDO
MAMAAMCIRAFLSYKDLTSIFLWSNNNSEWFDLYFCRSKR